MEAEHFHHEAAAPDGGDHKPSEKLDAFNVPIGEGPPESPL